MSNIEVYAIAVNGSLIPSIDKGDSCKRLVNKIIGDDTGAPARNLFLKITTASGKEVEIVIPNDNSSAIVKIDGEII